MLSRVIMNPFEAFEKYVALKNHFTQKSYDFFKYNGRVKLKADAFDRRRDKYFFVKLAKNHNVVDYLLANFIDGDVNQWVGDIVQDQESERIYKQWLARQQSLTYTFKQDLSKLNTDFDSNFIVDSNSHPRLLVLYLQKQICIETLIILDMLTGCFKYWDKKISDPVVWPAVKKKCERYKPFLSIDVDRYREIVVAFFQE